MSKTMTADAIAHGRTYTNEQMLMIVGMVERIARFTTYEFDEDESWSDDQAEDAIVSMNRLIEDARKLLGLEVQDPQPCRHHKDTGRGVCGYCGVSL